ncbi:MAG: Holliday junction branch migration protein RuvA [Clostridiales Family XIII bacterium]|jgi:Holliday junction DNA helicase RuvA|nr:Holliday junction branch migration protein RuvA [Clostridiales Family XIII bacterium]
MIAYIRGTMLEKLESSVVIDTGGVGYEVFVPANSHAFLQAKGDEVVLYTAQIFKEDDVSLYGFEDRAALRLFRLLITVSGVGAKAAMSIISSLSTDEAVRAIAFSDAAMLTRAQGIGKKSAERIVLELKDKVTDALSGLSAGIGSLPGGGALSAGGAQKGTVGSGTADIVTEAIGVLMGLGITRSEAAQAVMNVTEEYGTVEDCVRLALKGL